MTETSTQAEEQDKIKKIRLLATVRDKQRKEALKLIEEGTGVDFRDTTGKQPLHYAAYEGFNDVIEALVEKGANVNAWDTNGQTALHKAALQGHVDSIVALVAHGSAVEMLDRTGMPVLECAVKNKHVDAVETLCMFGAEPLLLDWTWAQDRNLNRKKAESAIARLIKKQLHNMMGYKHEAIKFNVKRVTADAPVRFDDTDVEVASNHHQPYYLYVCRMMPEYGTLPPLEDDEKLFGEILELHTWGSKVGSVVLSFSVDRSVRKNEEIVYKSINGKKEGEVKYELQEEKQVTDVQVTVPLSPHGSTSFTMAVKEKKQVFKMSKEAVVLTPDVAPGAEIDIPAGTFDSGDLTVKFVDTDEVSEENTEEEGSENKGENNLLMTSVLDINTSDNQQPNKDIQMKLPVKNAENKDDFVVLTTSNPDPNLEEWKWDTIPAEIDEKGKAVFTIGHFSIYAGASKSKHDEDPKKAELAIRSSFLRMKKVRFAVFVTKPQENETKTVVKVMCITSRKLKLEKRRQRKDMICFEHDDVDFDISEGQSFQIRLVGDLKDSAGQDTFGLEFQSIEKDCYKHIEVCGVDDQKLDLAGKVEILKETKYFPVVEMETTEGMLCSKTVTKKVKSDIPEVRTTSLVDIPFDVKLIKREAEEHAEDEMEEEGTIAKEERKDHCVIEVLKWKNLRVIMADVDPDEAKQLGSQLGIKGEDIDTLLEELTEENDLAMEILHKWRHKRPGEHQLQHLIKAVTAIGRGDIARELKQSDHGQLSE